MKRKSLTKRYTTTTDETTTTSTATRHDNTSKQGTATAITSTSTTRPSQLVATHENIHELDWNYDHDRLLGNNKTPDSVSRSSSSTTVFDATTTAAPTRVDGTCTNTNTGSSRSLRGAPEPLTAEQIKILKRLIAGVVFFIVLVIALCVTLKQWDQMSDDSAPFEPGSLSPEFVMAAIEQFSNQSLIPRRHVARILLSCRNYFANNNLSSSLIEIPLLPTLPPSPSHDHEDSSSPPSPPPPPRLTICGATYGQFYNVLHIFEINGYPNRSNPYLFNGDFVNLGSLGVELILTLLLFKLMDPQCIYLTRGDHESARLTHIYGFEQQVVAKYDIEIYNLFLDVFDWLPLAAVVNGKVFVAHGGSPVDPTTVTLEDIRNLSRGVEPPQEGLFHELLYYNNSSSRSSSSNHHPDSSSNSNNNNNHGSFLERNNLSLLIRSHQVEQEGYLVQQGGKTITIFSAPNYCDTKGNKGAFIHLNATLQPTFTQFDAVPHPDLQLWNCS